tara:strand:- start:616 stop:879 length:264 start_codon:yes stop_codon:yes gene_type:complete
MKLNYPANLNNISGSQTFKVGDLVIYAPYYDDPDGAWMMRGDMGVITQAVDVSENEFQIVKVKWISDDMDEVDMASDILKKIDLDNL